MSTFQELLKFTSITVQLAVVGVFFGILLGLVLAVARLSKNVLLRSISWTYIWILKAHL